MSIVPDLRLEQIAVRAGSVLDGATVEEASTAHGVATILAVKPASGEPIAYPRPEVRLAEGDLVVVLGPLQALDAMGRRGAQGESHAMRPGSWRPRSADGCWTALW